MTVSPVFIVAAAYGVKAIETYGQANLATIAARSGASGFEFRREFFPDGKVRFMELRAAVKENGLIAVYSAPWEMWTADGKLNRGAMQLILEEAKLIGASYVKMPLGAYRPVISDLDELKACIEDAGGAELPFQLTVENGPTVQGGNIRTLRSFFDNCAIQGIPVRMTFDIGNWSWCGENVFEAAEALTEFVVYLHCKQVNDRFKRTGPLTHDPEAAWRQVLARFPKELPRGGEFPIVGDDLEISTKQYVRELSIQS